MNHSNVKLLHVSIFALMLTACGSDNNKGSNDKVVPTPPTNSAEDNKFTKTAEWAVDTSKQGDTCFDFDSKAEVTCDGVTWDIKHTKEGRSSSLWSNSGTSGQGNGGVFGLRDWSELSAFTDATKMPDSNRDISRYYYADATSSVFSSNKWYEYNLAGGHQLYPNYNVYLVNTDKSNTSVQGSIQLPVFALQITNYYNDSGTSGYPSIRWIDTTVPNTIQTKTIDASKDWAYVNLDGAGSVVTKEENWHIAFKRNNVKLNGGDSGTGTVSGFVAKKPAGFYDEAGKPVTDTFTQDQSVATKTDLTDTSAYNQEVTWVHDSFGSALKPAYTGTYPNLDYGWYTYSGVTHKLSLKADADTQGAIVRSGEGNSYARMRLADMTDGQWTFKFDIQPAS